MTKRKNAGVKYLGKPLTNDPDDAPELLDDFFRHGELARSWQQADPARSAANIRQTENRNHAPTRSRRGAGLSEDRRRLADADQR
jgi:hypothetical protein